MQQNQLVHPIDSKSILYAVIGDPIVHSKSPIMMNRAFLETGINGVYVAFHIKDHALPDFVAGIRAMNIRGVNVTIPHKQAIMPLLDAIDPAAQAIGAVNTIVNDNGKLTGYNTDGIGYVRSLKQEAMPQLQGKKIVILGAGGAARGIVYALLQEQPEQIMLINRTVSKAEELGSSLQAYCMEGSVLQACSPEQTERIIAQADLVINTTSTGMFPNVEETPLDTSLLSEHTVVSDLIYNPLTTKFLLTAADRGMKTHGGLGMFIYQGAYAFEYWTGVDAPVSAMRDVVLASLS
ncbi:shikimate dehydrogenase [Paenibacillus yanchengensis]|uniref:Shikimate dehydrogenase (NADP(+)) n=1 Tax=Paenibacillus yanchengensis TaxID=2035833 RepID=A0ABW4YKN7_9BACL